MLIGLDGYTRKKLVLAKQMFQQAIKKSASTQNVVNRLDAVIGFDFANEMVIKAALRALGYSDLKPGIPKLLDELKKELAKRNVDLDYDGDIKYVRDVRNAAQHEGRYPNGDELMESRFRTRVFLDKLCHELWGVVLDSLSLMDLIVDPRVRGFLVSADGACANGDYFTAMVQVISAFETSTLDLERTMIGDFRRDHNLQILSPDDSPDPSNKDPLDAALRRIRKLLSMQVLGIDAQDYLRFTHYTRYTDVWMYSDGQFDSNLSGPEPTEEEVKYAITFVTDAVLQIQSLDDAVRFAAAPFHAG